MTSLLELSLEHYLIFVLSKDGIIISSNDRTNVILSVKKNHLSGQEFSKFVSRKHFFDFDQVVTELEECGTWRGGVWLYSHKKKYHFRIGLTITMKNNLLHCVGVPIKTSKENKEILKRLYHYINKYE